MKPTRVVVNDLMQKGYVYFIRQALLHWAYDSRKI